MGLTEGLKEAVSKYIRPLSTRRPQSQDFSTPRADRPEFVTKLEYPVTKISKMIGNYRRN